MNTLAERTAFFNDKFPDNRKEGENDLAQAHLVMFRILKVFDFICKKHDIQYWLEAGTLLGAIRHEGFIPWDDDLDVSMLRDDFNKFLAIAESELPEDIILQTEKTEKGCFFRGCPLKLRDTNSFVHEHKDNLKDEFSRGIFFDIFPYDSVTPNPPLHQWRIYYTRKILRFKNAKIRTGHPTRRDKFISKFISLDALNKVLENLIKKTNKKQRKDLTYGYDFAAKGVFPRDSIFPLTSTKFVDGEFPIPGDYDRFLTIKFGDYMQLPPEDERIQKHAMKIVPCLSSQKQQDNSE